MDEQEKQAYRESYQRAKEKGVPFFPNALFKDAIVSLIVFLALVALAALLGAPVEPTPTPPTPAIRPARNGTSCSCSSC
jgi:quinol-cytochrome oxidoreductase complex cytochrome b subunit